MRPPFNKGVRRDLQRETLLGDCGLVAYGLPVAGAADPYTGVAIGAAEVFAELMAFDVGAGGDDGGISVDADDHVGHVYGLIAKLAALPGGDGVLLGRDLS